MPPAGSHIGTLVKPHGYKGTLIMSGEADIIEELTEGIPLFIEISGQRIPFFIEEIAPDTSGKRCSVKFEFIDSDKEASGYVGCEVYADGTLNDSDETSSDITRLIGFEVLDKKSNEKYRVTDALQNPGNPLLVLESIQIKSKKSSEVYLPTEADYIIEISRIDKKIIAEFPEGLVEESEDSSGDQL